MAPALGREHGIIGAAVNRAAEDGNRVIVYHQAESRAELDAFAASPLLKVTMGAGGVTTRADFRFADAQPGAAY